MGVALDIGTTTVVAYLVNLRTWESLGTVGTMNPRRVMELISYRESRMLVARRSISSAREIVDTVNDSSGSWQPSVKSHLVRFTWCPQSATHVCTICS